MNQRPKDTWAPRSASTRLVSIESANAERAAGKSSATAASGDDTAATVFVVDDDDGLRKSLRELLESADLPVETYASGEEFLAAFDGERRGCLVLDVRLRSANGLDLQDELRRRKVLLPIIVLTGHGDVQTSVRAFKAGAVDFLQKPAPPAVLLERICTALEIDRRARAAPAGRATRDLRKRVNVRREQFLRERVARLKAQEASRSKDAWLATVAHELRSPANAIALWVGLLREGLPDPSTLRRALDAIDRGVKLQARLIDDLMDASRIVTGKLKLSVHPADLRRVLEDAVESVRLSAESKQIRFKADLLPSASPVTADCDVDRLHQVFSNVLSNAIKFTPPAGGITVRLRTEADRAVVTVTDSGCGISPAFLPHVFEPFRQASPSTTHAHTGLGLGLAIAHELVEQHGGTVSAESPGEGHGATFTVRLPTRATSRTDGAASLSKSVTVRA